MRTLIRDYPQAFSSPYHFFYLLRRCFSECMESFSLSIKTGKFTNFKNILTGFCSSDYLGLIQKDFDPAPINIIEEVLTDKILDKPLVKVFRHTNRDGRTSF